LTWAGDTIKPPVKCGRENDGAFWPEAANTSKAVLHRAEHCGTLLLCTRTTFGWKWEAMTVNVQSLVAKSVGGSQTAVEKECQADSAVPNPENHE
jgi:hypothetical protein